jgi:hypothetical protein
MNLQHLVPAALACIALSFSQSSLHGAEMPVAKPAIAPVVVIDFALAPGGLLSGQVVDAAGAPLAGAPVSVWHENHQVVQTVSDQHGQFSVAGLRGGVHQVVAGQNQGVYRLWTAQAAPPSAQKGTILLGNSPVVRGQNGELGRSLLTSPILWGGVMYAAGHVIGFNAGLDRSPTSP